jgi:hypothetical protein
MGVRARVLLGLGVLIMMGGAVVGTLAGAAAAADPPDPYVGTEAGAMAFMAASSPGLVVAGLGFAMMCLAGAALLNRAGDDA